MYRNELQLWVANMRLLLAFLGRLFSQTESSTSNKRSTAGLWRQIFQCKHLRNFISTGGYRRKDITVTHKLTSGWQRRTELATTGGFQNKRHYAINTADNDAIGSYFEGSGSNFRPQVIARLLTRCEPNNDIKLKLYNLIWFFFSL